MPERVLYARSVHGAAEIEAVLAVLNGGPRALRLGKNVGLMEERVAALFDKSHGLMVNSGSSALYLAVKLLDLPPGSEIITPALTFSTDITAIVQNGHVPVFIDVLPGTFNADASKIEEMISPSTRAILIPNLIGNTPDWDAIREIADRHGLKVIEDSCDALGATLHGTPTGARSDISATSFAMSHIITCAGNGGMLMLDDVEMRERGLLLRRWGRRSERNEYGAAKNPRIFREDLDGIPYDNDFIFDVMAMNLEPSELGAAFGLAQLESLGQNYAARQRTYDIYTEMLGTAPDVFELPVQTPGLVTAWLCYPLMLRTEAGFRRSDLQEYLDERGVDTRAVWTGNVTRQPMMRGVAHRSPTGGLPVTDDVMERGLILPANHGLTEAEVTQVCEAMLAFAADRTA
jgi:CDP-4-dehydro-6-deoxyglucose reductase, E1